MPTNTCSDFAGLTLACILFSVTSMAAEAPTEQQVIETVSELELGLGFLGRDAYALGRYSGIQDQGAFLLGDVDIRRHDTDYRYWKIRGINLGLDSRYLRLEAGHLGRQQYYLEFDQLPHNRTDSVVTPFTGSGTDKLRLPAGFVDITTSLSTALRPFESATQRRRLGLGARLFPDSHWDFKVDFRHETREGIDMTGGAIANGHSTLLANLTTSLLPEPIDHTTDSMDMRLAYAHEKAQFEIAYHMSVFNNAHSLLTWEDPFSPGNLAGQSLAPDNQYHQLRIAGSYLLPHSSRLNGQFAIGRMTQNKRFLPYSVRTGLGGPLPRNSLEGEVWQKNARLQFTTRPIRALRLKALYRFDQRDNDTPVDSFSYVVADSFIWTSNPGNPSATIDNRPLSYRRNQVEFSADYRFSPRISLGGGYEYDDMRRSYTDAERSRTTEDTLLARLKLKPHDNIDISLYGEAAQRDGSAYNTPADENPALRKFTLADRQRHKAGVSVDITPGDIFTVNLSGEFIEDDYENSTIGLTKSTEPTYTLELAYTPRRNVSAYAFYTHEDIRSEQAGSASGSATPDWFADFRDRVQTFGVGGKLSRVRGRWDLGADLVYSKASGSISLTDLVMLDSLSQYPDTRSELNRLTLWARYRYNKALSIRLSFWHESYHVDDWAIDGLDPTSVSNMLLLDESTADYAANAVLLSFIYRLDQGH